MRAARGVGGAFEAGVRAVGGAAAQRDGAGGGHPCAAGGAAQELSLQSLAAALIETGGFEEAARRLGELEKLNPSNTELPGLRAQLGQKMNAAKEKQ